MRCASAAPRSRRQATGRREARNRGERQVIARIGVEHPSGRQMAAVAVADMDRQCCGERQRSGDHHHVGDVGRRPRPARENSSRGRAIRSPRRWRGGRYPVSGLLWRSAHQFRDAWDMLGIDAVVLFSGCEEIDVAYQLSEVQATRDSGGAFEGVGCQHSERARSADRHLRLSRSNRRGNSQRADREGDCGRSAD